MQGTSVHTKEESSVHAKEETSVHAKEETSGGHGKNRGDSDGEGVIRLESRIEGAGVAQVLAGRPYVHCMAAAEAPTQKQGCGACPVASRTAVSWPPPARQL